MGTAAGVTGTFETSYYDVAARDKAPVWSDAHGVYRAPCGLCLAARDAGAIMSTSFVPGHEPGPAAATPTAATTIATTSTGAPSGSGAPARPWTTGGATPPGSLVMYGAAFPPDGGDPIYCQSGQQAEDVAAALNARDARPASEVVAEQTRRTAARINALPQDATKAEVVIHGQRLTLYLARFADGEERWLSGPAYTPGERPLGNCDRDHSIGEGCEGWQGTAYRVALADRDGRAVPLGTIAAKRRQHAEGRAAKLGAKVW